MENERVIVDTPLPISETPKKEDPFKIPEVQMGQQRSGLLKRLLERGRISRSENTFAELQQKKFLPDLMHTETNCMDEAELRNRFPNQGVDHKFFKSGEYKFVFKLPSDSDNVVVAQVIWNGKVRMSSDWF